MITQSVFSFLKSLKKNNNREWFNKNKSGYLAAKNEFEDFINSLIPLVAGFDETLAGIEVKDCVYRIYRDIRFSKDKTPYKIWFSAHLVPGGKKNENEKSGYYVQVAPGDSMLGGGAYMPPPERLKAIREKIIRRPEEFKKIINEKRFKKYFGEIEGDKLKSVPKGIPKDHPDIELLKYKSYLATHYLTDDMVLSNKFLKHTAEVFEAYYPFCRFLNSD